MAVTIINEIPKVAEKIGADLDQFIRAVKIELFNGVIRTTRVDTGRLRGNWQTTIGQPARSEIDRQDQLAEGLNGGQAMDEVQREVKAFTTMYLTNNLPYAEVWEEEDGMVARSVARLERTIAEQARRNR